MTPTLPTPADAGLQNLIEKAKTDLALDDLAQRLGISVEEINLVSVTKTTWPDASLGCPKFGVLYIQVITDGYLILLDANGTTYEYHTETGEQVILCENAEFPIIPVTPGEINDGESWVPN